MTQDKLNKLGRRNQCVIPSSDNTVW